MMRAVSCFSGGLRAGQEFWDFEFSAPFPFVELRSTRRPKAAVLTCSTSPDNKGPHFRSQFYSARRASSGFTEAARRAGR
jgi:hypothetical protein